MFRNAENAALVVDAINFQRSDRAMILAYVVMPDHLHLLVVPCESYQISKIMQSIKGYTSRAINERTGERGTLWQQGFYDRVVRTDEQLFQTIEYIHQNPVKDGLAQYADEYRWSSAFAGIVTDLAKFL